MNEPFIRPMLLPLQEIRFNRAAQGSHEASAMERHIIGGPIPAARNRSCTRMGASLLLHGGWSPESDDLEDLSSLAAIWVLRRSVQDYAQSSSWVLSSVSPPGFWVGHAMPLSMGTE